MMPEINHSQLKPTLTRCGEAGVSNSRLNRPLHLSEENSVELCLLLRGVNYNIWGANTGRSFCLVGRKGTALHVRLGFLLCFEMARLHHSFLTSE